MQAPVTFFLIGITCLVSWMAFNNRKLMDRLILWPPAIDQHRQYDRLVTYGFIHGDFMHLLFNMVTLFFFGQQIEQLMTRVMGIWAYPVFYVSALVVSILPTYLKNQKNPNYLSLGASGAVSAVLFAFVLLAPWSTIGVMFIPMPAIVFAVLYVGYSIWMTVVAAIASTTARTLPVPRMACCSWSSWSPGCWEFSCSNSATPPLVAE